MHNKEKWKERKKITYIYIYNLLYDIVHILEFKGKWFFFEREMVQQGEMERKKYISIYI